MKTLLAALTLGIALIVASNPATASEKEPRHLLDRDRTARGYRRCLRVACDEGRWKESGYVSIDRCHLICKALFADGVE